MESMGLPPAPEPQLRRVRVDGVDLWVLDEGMPELPYGGNKVRKLRGILAEALSAGARDLVTFGAWGSHHVYATAVWGQRVGLRTHAVWIRQPSTEHVAAMARASQRACASVQVARALAELPVVTAGLLARVTAATGRPPFQVPPGGSSRAGTRGWVELAAALPGHLAALDAVVDEVVVPSGSGGTAAGLLASGLEVRAVRVGPRALTHRARLRHLARRAGADTLGELVIDSAYLAGGYGEVDERTQRALEAGRAAGLPVETTYGAKALACALDRARDGRRVLFVQTASATTPRCESPLVPALRDALGLSCVGAAPACAPAVD